MAAEKFTIQIPNAILTDLAHRLETTRWPDELEGAGWEFGSNLDYVRSLADYWRHRVSRGSAASLIAPVIELPAREALASRAVLFCNSSG